MNSDVGATLAMFIMSLVALGEIIPFSVMEMLFPDAKFIPFHNPVMLL